MGVADFVGGVVVLVIGLGITFFAARLPYMSEYGPGSGLLPLWIGIIMSACALGVIVKAVRRRGGDGLKFYRAKTGQAIFTFATLVATILLIPLLGLSASLALFTGFTSRVTGKHSWLLCLVVTVATAAAVRVIFGWILDIPLPKGLIGF